MKSLPIDKDLEHMLISAARYACGRRTYIVSVTVDYIMPILPELSDWCLSIMRKDLDDAFSAYERSEEKFGLGDKCDVAVWQKFAQAVSEEIGKRKGKKSDE